jgi:hypothetical protein
VVARQGRLARGWVITIAVMVVFVVLFVLALLLRSAWWIGEGPMTSLPPETSPTARLATVRPGPPFAPVRLSAGASAA